MLYSNIKAFAMAVVTLSPFLKSLTLSMLTIKIAVGYQVVCAHFLLSPS